MHAIVDTGASIVPIHTAVPGRARLRIPRLYRSPALKRALETRVPDGREILTASANVLTGTILVQFETDFELWQVIIRIEGVLSGAPANGRTDSVRSAIPGTLRRRSRRREAWALRGRTAAAASCRVGRILQTRLHRDLAAAHELFDALDGLGGLDRVQRGEDGVSRLGGSHRDLDRLAVAHLATRITFGACRSAARSASANVGVSLCSSIVCV